MYNECYRDIRNREKKRYNMQLEKPTHAPAIAAHRGASRRYPGNSLAAIKEAINIAMEHPAQRFFIEMDLRKTADGALVLMHDSDVSLTTNGRGKVERMTAEQVTSLDMQEISDLIPKAEYCRERCASPLFPIEKTDLRPAALHEVMALVEVANHKRMQQGQPIGLAMEIKPAGTSKNPFIFGAKSMLSGVAGLLDIVGLDTSADIISPSSGTAMALAQALNMRSGALPPMVVFSSRGQSGKRDLEVLLEGLNDKAKAHIGANKSAISSPTILVDKTDKRPAHILAREAIQHTKRFFTLTTPDVMPIITTAKPRNSSPSMVDAIASGANFITTDYPDRMAKLIEDMAIDKNAEAPATPEHSFLNAEIERRGAEQAGAGPAV